MANTYNDRGFIELLLRHLYLSPAVLKKAVSLGVTADDFLPPGPFELPAYKVLAGLALEINHAPVDLELLSYKLRSKGDRQEVTINVVDECIPMLDRIYRSGAIMDDYFLEELPKFLRARRSAKIVAEAAGDLDRLHEQYKKVIFPLDTLADAGEAVESRFVNPFDSLLKKAKYAMISTGFAKLNAALGGGLGFREFGLVVGHSGGGKTALGVAFARGAAMAGHKVLYCSMEEEKEDIANRLYASVFEVDYTSLHNGSGYMELEQKAALPGDHAEKVKLMKDNFLILDLKGLTPIKPSRLKHMADEYAVKHGFTYELMVVDQLQFLEPEVPVDGEQEWSREGRIVKELDEISHYSVGENSGKFFGMWVLHQAKGKVKINFSTDEIAGFKGIVHKPETVLGIGRENPVSNDFEIFSMKNRHAKNFRLPISGNLQFMTFIEKAEGAGDASGAPAAPAKQAVSPINSAGNYGAPEMAQLMTVSGPPAPPPLVGG